MNTIALARNSFTFRSFKPLTQVLRMLNTANATEQFSRNQLWFKQIVRSQRRGITCLPDFLGLKPTEFHWMSRGRNYRVRQELMHDHAADQQRMEQDLRQQLLEMREDEWVELRDMMVDNRAGVCDSELVMADIVAAACLGGTHLWRDLGMADRQQLNDLMHSNFPALAARNDRDMKWKKFFYKQLCELGGGYVCRAPSCDVCTAYADCFGPED